VPFTGIVTTFLSTSRFALLHLRGAQTWLVNSHMRLATNSFQWSLCFFTRILSANYNDCHIVFYAESGCRSIPYRKCAYPAPATGWKDRHRGKKLLNSPVYVRIL
jgi:hypothetical protein